MKVSSSNDESGYDAMKMFKQHSKTITDEEILKEDDMESKTGKNNTDNNKKKKRKKDTEHSDINQECDSTVENVRNVEQDCENQSKRQTILLSATLTQAIEKLAGLTMRDPIFVDAARENLEASGGDTSAINEDLIVPQSVIQNYIITPPKLRMVALSAYIAGRCQVGKSSVSTLATYSIVVSTYDLCTSSIFLFLL